MPIFTSNFLFPLEIRYFQETFWSKDKTTYSKLFYEKPSKRLRPQSFKVHNTAVSGIIIQETFDQKTRPYLRTFDPVRNFLHNFFLRENMLAACPKI